MQSAERRQERRCRCRRRRPPGNPEAAGLQFRSLSSSRSPNPNTQPRAPPLRPAPSPVMEQGVSIAPTAAGATSRGASGVLESIVRFSTGGEAAGAPPSLSRLLLPISAGCSGSGARLKWSLQPIARPSCATQPHVFAAATLAAPFDVRRLPSSWVESKAESSASAVDEQARPS